MSTLTFPSIDRRRPQPAAPATKAAPSFALFAPDEVGWLEVEAGSRLAAAGTPLTTLRLDEPTPLARLARDPRLLALAATIGDGERVLTTVELGRAAVFRHRRLSDTTLFVELGGGVHGRPGTVHVDLDGMASTTLFLAAGFRCAFSDPAERDLDAAQKDDLWPPAAVVAG